jgi:hypothetical protein
MAFVPDAGRVYPLLGRPQDSLAGSQLADNVAYPQYHGATFDASTTNLSYTVPGYANASTTFEVTLSFLSPITPTSTFRQSLPASYLTVYVKGQGQIDIYVDVNGEWVSGNRDNRIFWELQRPEVRQRSTAPIKTWAVRRDQEQELTEFADRSEWGTLHFSAPTNVYHQAGVSAQLRQQFAGNGRLRNVIDSGFRRIMEEEPVFAFSKSFNLSSESQAGSSAAEDSVLFTFALTHEPVVQFASARGLTLMRPLWASYFSHATQMVEYHYGDFKTAAALASNYSNSLAKDAFNSGSASYQDIAALSARQVLGATQFSGTPDNPILFLKEISSNGNFQTVDVIFPAFPFFLYTNPQWLAYLLEPLLEHQLSGQYPNQYSMHDLGYHFPNATGHGDGNDEYMPVEECGNMLIMGLALANAFKYDTKPAVSSMPPGSSPRELSLEATRKWISSIDEHGMDKAHGHAYHTGPEKAKKWVSRSYKLWNQWTGYLVREALIPRNQLTTDDFAGWLANHTNLALKGIVGIRAMSEIANLLGKDKDAKHYATIAEDYIDKWQDYAISRDGTHAKLAYTWYGSWTTLYNLFADSLLCFHLPSKSSADAALGQTPLDDKSTRSPFIPDKIYKIQSDWYHAVLQEYGLPLDSRHLYTKLDWEFFAAAVAGKKTRAELLDSVARWVNQTSTGTLHVHCMNIMRCSLRTDNWTQINH